MTSYMNRENMRQVMDLRAALIAGVAAGLVFLVLLIITPLLSGVSPWVTFRFIAALLLGRGMLVPPDTFSLGALVAGTLIHMVLAIAFTLLLAFIIHRWGLVIGIVGGALFGMGLFLINFFALVEFFDWMVIGRTWGVLIAHVIFGAVGGGVYEALEVERFVPDDD